MQNRLTNQTVPASTAKDIFAQLKENGYNGEQIVAVSNQLIMMACTEMYEKNGHDLAAGFTDYDLEQLGMPSD